MARPKLTPDTDSIRLQIVVPAALARAVDGWALERGVTRSEAARVLLSDALAPKRPGPPSKATVGRSTPSGTASAGRCLHPISRRIGKGCGACGQENVG